MKNKIFLLLLLLVNISAIAQNNSGVKEEGSFTKSLRIPKKTALPAIAKDGQIIQLTSGDAPGMYQRINGVWTPVGGTGGASRFDGTPVITWSGVGLIYNVFVPAYWIEGIYYPAINTQVTLAAAPITQSRFDVIIATVNNTVQVLKGDSAVSPIKKNINTSTSIEVGSIYVNHGDTVPTNRRINWVYREGVEWDSINNMMGGGMPLVFRDITAPFAGTYNIKAYCYSQNSAFGFEAPAPVPIDSFQSFSLKIKLNSTLYSGIYLQAFNNGTPVSKRLQVLRGASGFIPDFNGWQQITIASSEFWPGKEITTLMFSMEHSDCTGWQMDDLSFQGNIAVVSTPDRKIIGVRGDTGLYLAPNNTAIPDVKGTGGIQVYADANGWRVDGSGIVGGGGGGGTGITKVLAGWGIAMNNDSTPRVDSLLAISRLRFKNSMDSLGLVLAGKVNTSDYNGLRDSVATALGGKTPTTRTLTINGTALDLSANRTWTVGDLLSSGSYSNPSWLTALAWSKITGTPTTVSGYGITDAVPTARTLTINGTALDLSANRSWTVGDVLTAPYNTYRDSVATALAGKLTGSLNNNGLVFSANGIAKDSAAFLSYDRGNAAVGIGIATPASTSLLDMRSANKGLLIPRMTTANRNAIIDPATGLMVYDTDIKTIYWYNGGYWISIGIFRNDFNASYIAARTGAGGSSINARNTLLSDSAGFSLTTGTANFLGGYKAGYLLTDASDNIAIGDLALSTKTTGTGSDQSVAIGSGALQRKQSGSNSRGDVAIGFGAQNNSTLPASALPNTSVGYSSLGRNTTGYGNAFLGDYAGYGPITGFFNTGVGSGSMYSINTAAQYCTALGQNSMRAGGGSQSGTLSYNVAAGAGSMSGHINAGSFNVAYGSLSAGDSGTTGNITVGHNSANKHIGTTENITIGRGIMNGSGGIAGVNTGSGTNFTGSYNTAIAVTVRDTTGSNQFAVGGNLVRWIEKTTAGNFILNSTGTNVSVNPSGALDVPSTTMGFLPPRMTKAQRNLIVSPAIGLVVYQTDNTPGLRCYNGTNWMKYTETAD